MVLEWINVVNNVQPCRCSANGMQRRSNVVMLSGRVQQVVVPQPTPFRRRFNLRKADWNGYSTELDNRIEEVKPIPSNYNRFVENVRVASRRHIPIGYITDYVQGLTAESRNLYEAYKQQYSSNPFNNRTIESGNLQQNKLTKEEHMGGSHHIDKHDS